MVFFLTFPFRVGTPFPQRWRFSKDTFGAVCGALRGGGVLMLCTPPLDEWKETGTAVIRSPRLVGDSPRLVGDYIGDGKYYPGIMWGLLQKP